MTRSRHGNTAVDDSKRLAAPSVRSIIRANNLNINNIHGTGKDGRVTKEDVLAFMAGKQTAAKPTEAAPKHAAAAPAGAAAVTSTKG